VKRNRPAELLPDRRGVVGGDVGHGGARRQAGFAAGHIHGEVLGEPSRRRQAHPQSGADRLRVLGDPAQRHHQRRPLSKPQVRQPGGQPALHHRCHAFHGMHHDRRGAPADCAERRADAHVWFAHALAQPGFTRARPCSALPRSRPGRPPLGVGARELSGPAWLARPTSTNLHAPDGCPPRSAGDRG
jgi:hypothetical protein